RARVFILGRLKAALERSDPLLACPQVAVERVLDLWRGVERSDLAQLVLRNVEQVLGQRHRLLGAGRRFFLKVGELVVRPLANLVSLGDELGLAQGRRVLVVEW